MKYIDFIELFLKKNDINNMLLKYNYYFFYLLKIKKIIDEIDIDDSLNINEFLKFVFENKIIRKKEILNFFNIFKEEKCSFSFLDKLFKSYKDKKIDLEDFLNKSLYTKKIILLYKDYLKVNYKKINDIDKENIFIFLKEYSNFYYNLMRGGLYDGNLDFYKSGIKGDLNFLRILGIKKMPFYTSYLNVDYNLELKSLRGCPEKLDNLYCRNCGLESLDIENVIVKRDFDCSDNKNLKSLRGSPKEVNTFYCCNCGLESLDIENVIVKTEFDCSNNKNLKSLRGSPKFVWINFYCKNCGLEELGIQEGVEIGYNFNCSFNRNLKTLKGNPKSIKGNFDCRNCGLNEIDLDKNTEIGGDLYCLEGNNVTKKQVEEYIKKNNIKIKGNII